MGILEDINNGTIEEPEFFPEDNNTIEPGSPGLAISNLGARGFIREFCWLVPQVYEQENNDATLMTVPAYRNEFIVMHKDTFDVSKNPTSIYNKLLLWYANSNQNINKVPKIYYLTRTHSQITQVVNELKRIPWYQCKINIIASR
jgi:hypothetical protein